MASTYPDFDCAELDPALVDATPVERVPHWADTLLATLVALFGIVTASGVAVLLGLA